MILVSCRLHKIIYEILIFNVTHTNLEKITQSVGLVSKGVGGLGGVRGMIEGPQKPPRIQGCNIFAEMPKKYQCRLYKG